MSKRYRHGGIFAILFLGLIAVGCEDDMVTIAGHVTNVDTLVRAEGARVTLLDTEYTTDVPTESDGAFTLRVPKGSTLYLATDDFDPADDDWFPLINVDVAPIIAERDLGGFQIHACPRSTCPEDSIGSVAAWDHYLADGSDRERFASSSSAASGGVVALLFWFCEGGAVPTSAGLEVDLGHPGFPVGYVDTAAHFDDNGQPRCSLGPDILLPAGSTTTDFGGVVLSFGDPGTDVSWLDMTVTDHDQARDSGLDGPYRIPVRPGTISLIFTGVADGRVEASWQEIGRCAGLF